MCVREEMYVKKNIHPELHEIVAHCACGAEFVTRSTATNVKVTLCSQCHPFFTGAQKFVDTAGRIEKFHKRYQKASGTVANPADPSSKAADKSREPKALNKAKASRGQQEDKKK